MKPRLNNKEFIKYLKDNYSIVLNEGQESSVLYIEGPILVVAVPGAGKTFAITVRLFNMIYNYLINPSKILAVTFSKASAKDMDDRFEKFFGDVLSKEVKGYSENPMRFSTIHSFSYQILRDYSSRYNIRYKLIENIKKKVISDIYATLLNDTITDDVYEEITSQISYAKNKLMSKSEIQSMGGINCPKFYDIFIAYEKYKEDNGYIDYDDMLSKTYEILETDTYIRDKYSSMFDYIIVDEGQDTSTVQFKIIQIIAEKRNNICCVGDDDQSLYEWRSADVDNFLYFDRFFPNTKKIFMEQNYRSSNEIIKLSNLFIKTNKKRYDKQLFTNNPNGENINIIKCSNYESQISYIVNKLSQEEDLSKNAVLFRNNISSFAIANELIKNNIPFYMRDYKQNFFSHWVYQDIINFINFSIDIKNVELFKKIAFKMNRYISGKMLYHISKLEDDNMDVFEKLLTYPDLKRYQRDNILVLKQEFARLRNKNASFAIDYICFDLNYFDYLDQMSEKLGYSLDGLKERIFIIKELSSDCKDLLNLEQHLGNFKYELDQSKNNYGKNVVVLTSCHSSKGLEWETVYMMDLIDGVFPSYKAISNAKEGDFELLEAERRLFYVGMTRSKLKLHLLFAENKNNNFFEHSQFIDELLVINKKLDVCLLKEFSIHNNKDKVSFFNFEGEKVVEDFGKKTKKEGKSSQISMFKTNKPKKQTTINRDIKPAINNSIIKNNVKVENNNPYGQGKEVIHSSLGKGVIVNHKGDFIEVKFLSGKSSTLHLEKCLKKGLIHFERDNKNSNTEIVKEDTTPYSEGKEITHISLGKGVIVKNKGEFIDVKFLSGKSMLLNLDKCIKKGLIK